MLMVASLTQLLHVQGYLHSVDSGAGRRGISAKAWSVSGSVRKAKDISAVSPPWAKMM